MNMMHFPLNIPANRNLLSLPNIYVPNIDNNNIDVPISSNGNDDDIDVGEYLNSD